VAVVARADDAAQRLLRQFGVVKVPVQPESIAEGLGAIVVTQSLEPDVSGMLVREGDELIIGVNKHHPLVRRRFTVAHECGHLELHRGRALILDTSVRINFRDRVSSLATDREEMEANRFAAALLMPEEMVVEEAARAPRDPEELVRSLARRFKVSEPAMGYRLINLGVLT
jgi:Zn-dependent peptidase ImmA (M78 family)